MGDSCGDGNPADGEVPVRSVRMPPFDIDSTTITNAQWARFASDTRYVTQAESIGFSAVFHLALTGPVAAIVSRAANTPWWLGVEGADWRHPTGPDSSYEELLEHPVVHVSWHDCMAYCEWAGRALPSEAQWECASRGGLVGTRFPWGNEQGDTPRCNIWQGDFPLWNTMEDGYLTTAPVHSFEPNGYGLWQTVGNVWEWCADVWSVQPARFGPTGLGTEDDEGSRVMRGGSYLCHDSYCNRYRNSARSSNTPQSSTGNIGFRTVSQ
jgi:sulfatase modifying factor 1